MTASAQALTAFEEDVNAAVEDGIVWSINANLFTNGTSATGQNLLAMLEQGTIAQQGGLRRSAAGAAGVGGASGPHAL